MKRLFVLLVAPIVRGYLRFVPWELGKIWAWEKIYSRFISGRPLAPKLITSRFGAHMSVEPGDLVQTVIWLTGQWEPWITRHVLEGLRAGDIFIDVGANVGYYTLLASNVVGKAGSVYAFEASPSIFAKLQKNLRLNDASSNVQASCTAVSAVRGELRLWLAGTENQGHSTTVDALARKEGLRLEATVPADTLDGLVPHEDLFRARFIKIDVEGAERQVLEPLSPLMSRFSADTEWLIELSPSYLAGGRADVDWIFGLFARNGYGAFRIPNDYRIRAYIQRPTLVPRMRLTEPPTHELADVLFSKRID